VKELRKEVAHNNPYQVKKSASYEEKPIFRKNSTSGLGRRRKTDSMNTIAPPVIATADTAPPNIPSG
jgi:hypothetical protein